MPAKDLAEVLEAENRPDLFIGGSVNHDTNTITFWRGDLKPLTVPLTTFEQSGAGTRPDFNKFAVIDCGQTVQLGAYEAAVDAILYEFDPEYRRRISKQRLQESQTFGASLRRLRKRVQSPHSMKNQGKTGEFLTFVGLVSGDGGNWSHKKRRLLREYASLKLEANTYPGKDASMENPNLLSIFW